MVVGVLGRGGGSVPRVPAQTLQRRSTAADPSDTSGRRPGPTDPSPVTQGSGVSTGRRRWHVHATTIVVVVTGAILTVVVAFATVTARENNDERLLRQRTREAAAVLTAALPGIETPLASAAEVVEESAGADQQAFERLLTPLAEAGQPYVSASLWRVDSADPQPITVVGTAPKLTSQPPDVIRAFLQRAVATEGLVVIGLLDGNDPRLGYAVTSTRASSQFVAYAEAGLPPDRTSVVPADSAFSGLHNAVYLGDTEDPDQLLIASTPDLPLHGKRATSRVDFGDTSLLLVMTPDEELGGRLLAILPWLVLAFGLVGTLGSATLTEWVLRRRDDAERLSDENARLYAAQRTVAQTLQHSLLPDRLPDVPGVDMSFRYLPGAGGIDIGGDWYDAIPLDDNRLMIAVGDVSGRGLGAGAVMASLRYSIRAFASQGDMPATVLTKLSNLLDLSRDRHFATVLCAVVDVAGRTITIANAGHPNPLLIDAAGIRFIDTRVGVPIGVTRGAEYETVTESIPPESTLLAYTDGLFERRDESVDDGLERLRASASGASGSLEELLTQIVNTQAHEVSDDDTAILGVRWRH